MKALILRADPDASVATAHALTEKGFQVLCLQSQTVAHALIRIDTLDLLVMEEEVGGQLTHAIALSAERRNPGISAILMTDRASAEIDELYELVPSVYALVGTETPPALLAQLAQSATADMADRAARLVAQAQAEAKIAAEAAPIVVDEVTPPEEVEQEPELPPLVLSDAMRPDDDEGSGSPEPAPQLPAFIRQRLQDVQPAPETEIIRVDAPQRVDDAVLAKVAALFESQRLPTYEEFRPIRRAQAS
ncbi:MAG: hypothetical protein AAFU41_02330 [Pseudomonadota bacterium]